MGQAGIGKHTPETTAKIHRVLELEKELKGMTLPDINTITEALKIE